MTSKLHVSRPLSMSSARLVSTRLALPAMTVLVAVISGVYGLVIGSFLNVVIWRVPRQESLVKPRSHCPACDAPIATRDNIPVVSWLVLRGRCRQLRRADLDPLPARRAAHRRALRGGRRALRTTRGRCRRSSCSPRALIAISAIDLEHFIIPNRIVYPLGFAERGPARGRGGDRARLVAVRPRAARRRSAAFTFFFVLHLVAPGGMGFGDVRLSFVLGLFLGWLGWAVRARRTVRRASSTARSSAWC